MRALGARAGAAAERTGGTGASQGERRGEGKGGKEPWEFLGAWESWNGHLQHTAGSASRGKVQRQEELLPCSTGICISVFCSVAALSGSSRMCALGFLWFREVWLGTKLVSDTDGGEVGVPMSHGVWAVTQVTQGPLHLPNRVSGPKGTAGL